METPEVMKNTKPTPSATSSGTSAVYLLRRALTVLCLALPLALWPSAPHAKLTKAERAERAAQRAEQATASAETVGSASAGSVKDGTSKQRVLSLSFKQMGYLSPIKLRGVDGAATLPFSIRSDEVVVAAKLKFDYNYSPSLIPELSHLQVLLNEEMAAVIPLPRDKILQNVREMELDPRLFGDYNKLRFNLIGHYTYKCEDPIHSSLWLNLSNLGHIELTLAPLALTNDLKYLPVPFFDKRDNTGLKLPFVFASTPSFGALKAAGVVASWFGGLASYRGSQFPVSLNALPEGNAVVVLQAGEKIGAIEAGAGAGVAIITHPNNPNAKLLVISGHNDDELLRAARAVALDHTTLRGPQVGITQDSEPPARKPYDAPAWVPTDKPVSFGVLARQEDLQVRGYFPDVVRVNFRVSPDMFTWRSAGVPMELKYRFTRLPFNKNSTLNISVNHNFIQALSLTEPGKKTVPIDLLKLPVLDNSLALRRDVLFVPPYQVGERNQLQLHYFFDVVKEGECRDALPDNLEAAIDAESTLDFSSFPHYAALPNLAFFANIGFPFTRMADLSETAVILPERPDASELSAYLMVMGRMGEATGYPVLRHQVVTASQLDRVADRDLLVIGSAQTQPLMEKWAAFLPMVQGKGERRVRTPDVFRRALYRWEGDDIQSTPRPNATLSLKGSSDISTMMAFESPLKSSRSVVFLYADKSADLRKIGDTMRSPDLVPSVQGDFVVVDDNLVSNAKVGETYYVGSLPWTLHLRWFFSNHPVAISLFALFICIVLAVLVYRILRRVAARRLGKRA
jgi:hypothetical protein